MIFLTALMQSKHKLYICLTFVLADVASSPYQGRAIYSFTYKYTNANKYKVQDSVYNM